MVRAPFYHLTKTDVHGSLSGGTLLKRKKVTENLKEALRGDQEEETKSPAQNACADSAWIRHFPAPASWV